LLEGAAENPYMNRPVGAPVADETGTSETPRRTVQAPSVSRFLMIFLFLLGLWTLIDANLRDGFAFAADVVLWPLIGFGGRMAVITILLAGVFTTTVSSVLRHYFSDWVKMARTQRWLRSWQRERMDAIRKGNKARVEQLLEAQKGFSKDLLDLQASPLKATALTFFMFIVVFNWLTSFVTVRLGGAGNMWIAVPWSPNVFLLDVYVFPAWLLLYSLLAIPFGQIVGRVLKYVRFRRRLHELGVPLRADAGDAG